MKRPSAVGRRVQCRVTRVPPLVDQRTRRDAEELLHEVEMAFSRRDVQCLRPLVLLLCRPAIRARGEQRPHSAQVAAGCRDG